MVVGFLKEPSSPPDGQWLFGSLALLAVWFCIFILKYAAGYALWFNPYISRRRAIIVSVIAILAVYSGLMGCGILFLLFEGHQIDFKTILSGFYEFSKYIYGVPYIVAALVGWRFAHRAPDIRDSF